MTTVVFGARGNVGSHVVAGLLEAGEPVRAAGRDAGVSGLARPGIETVIADLVRPETLGPALAGAEKVFLYAHPEGIDGFLEAAREAGVQRVVLLSSASVVRAEAASSPIARRHRAVEVALEESSLEWTFVRGGMFATNAVLWWQGPIRQDGVVRLAYPEAHTAPLHEADLAAVAVTALLQEGHAGRAYPLWGAESLSLRDQVAAIASAAGRPVRIEVVSPERSRVELSGAMPAAAVDGVLAMWAASGDRPAPTSTVVPEVTGRPARTFARWAADHATDFR